LDEQIFGTNAARYSVISVVDSNRGTDDLHNYFNIPIDKIRVIPHKVPGYIYSNHDMNADTAKGILSRFDLPEKYLFYPSQFEHAKNHKRLIQALKLVESNHGMRVPLILAGREGDSFKEIMTLIRQYRMTDQVVHLGFASGKEIVALYRLAVALVYVSLGGPTNLPPLEAMILGTPVLCSNLFSMPEQVGDAGLLFDPFRPEDMAEKIYMIWTDEDLRRRLIEHGSQKRKNELTQDGYAKQWESVIGNAMQIIGKQ
jgi:glycosyltransferase involved in cell wall biosynthesis